MKSGNPVLSEHTFEQFSEYGPADTRVAHGQAMTVEGTVNKSLILLLLAVVSASFTWNMVLTPGGAALAMPLAMGGALGAFIIALVTSFKPNTAPYTAPIYALLKGLLLGAFSSILNAAFPGIVTQTVGLTFGTLAAMLLAYKSGAIKVTDKFVLGIVAATGGILLVYLLTMVLGLFGVAMPYIHGTGPIGIGFSLFVVVIAALTLVLDFAMIEEGADHGAPKFMEWYGAFSLMVTLFWLYIRILDLLSRLNSRD